MRILKNFLIAAALVAVMLAGSARAEETFMTGCFTPAPDSTKVIEYEAKKPPYKIAFVNGYAGNDWRVTAIQAAKAWANRPENKELISEFKVVSVGNDSAAQIAAIDNFMAAGYDGITFISVNPTAFDAVIRRAKREGTVLVAFDNVVDNANIVSINGDQEELGRLKAQAVLDGIKAAKGAAKGKILEVTGVAGTSVDRDSQEGVRKVFAAEPGIEVIQVVGNWDAGTGQKATADAIAAHGFFDGVIVQEGAVGPLVAMDNAKHPVVPVGMDVGNGTRMEIARKKYPGITAAQPPAMSSVALEAVKVLLQGHPLPQKVFLPIPQKMNDQLVEGEDYFPDLPKAFYTTTGYSQCFKPFTPDELLGQTPADN